MRTTQVKKAFSALMQALYIEKNRASVLQAFELLCKACKCWGRTAFCQWAFKHDLPLWLCRSVAHGKLFV